MKHFSITPVAFVLIWVTPLTALAGNHLVQIDEVAAGANGDARIQFIELKFCCEGENLWGPQDGEGEGRVRLVFYDATDAQTGEFIFPSDPAVGLEDPEHGGFSVLIATQEFAKLPDMPAPDFLIPPLVIAQFGKVCFKHNPNNANASAVNLCLSYGGFVGDTETDTSGQPAGPPTAAAPITDAVGVQRFANFGNYGTGQFNADFTLATPRPRNSDGQIGQLPVEPLVVQGETLFVFETFLGNSRTCSTCHRSDAGFSLSPALIASLPPDDPLFVAEFNPELAELENPCLMRGPRALILENIDGFENPPVFRASPHLLNVESTGPYGLSGDIPTLQDFIPGAVRQHLPKTLNRNADPSLGPLDFRMPTELEVVALKEFMHTIRLPEDGNLDLDRMINAAVAQGADADQIQLGRDLFTGASKCFLCHGGPTLSTADVSLGGGNQSFTTGVVNLPINGSEPCLDGEPLPPEDGGNRVFNTAALIGVSETAPYFHDDSVATLRESVEFYKSQQFNESPAAEIVGEINLMPPETDAITAFLTALLEPIPADCNDNGIDDILDIANGTSKDCNTNSIPDECELAKNDCNGNEIPDDCDTAAVRLIAVEELIIDDGSFAVEAIDVNGDSLEDLASANWNDGTISVFLSNGDGSFVAAGTFPVGVLPHSLTRVDLDDDGDPDLVVANLASDDISVLLNRGVDESNAWLGFGATQTFAVGVGPLAAAAADLNGDGKQDIVVANDVSNDVSVLVNLGNDEFDTWLGFAPPENYDVAVGPWDIAVGKFNNDNAPDVVVANRSSHNVSILLNNGDGSFGPATDIAVGNSPESVTAEDLSGDGVGDLAVANFNSDTVSVMIGNGDGTFGEVVNIGVGTYPFGASPRSVIAARLDEDEFLDLAVANHFSENISILLNNGDGTFVELVNFPVSDKPEAVAAADIDGDGVLDLVAVHFVSRRVSVFLNETPPFGTDCNENNIPDDCDIAGGGSFDINGNGVPDECEPNGDSDRDGDVDLVDAADFLACVSGPGGGADPPCDEFDFELDGDVDFTDFGRFQLAFTGPR